MNIAASPDPTAISSANYEGKVPITVTLAPTSLSSPTLPPPIHALLPRNTYLHIGLASVIQRLHSFAPPVLSFEAGTVKTEPDVARDGDNGDSGGDRTRRSSDADTGVTVESTVTTASAPESQSRRRRNSTIDGDPASSVPVCWFEDEETQMALRWHLFVGALFDLRPSRAMTSTLHGRSGKDDEDKNDDDNDNHVGLLPQIQKPPAPSLPWRLRLHFNNYPTSQLLPLASAGTRPGSSTGGVIEYVHATYKHSLKQALCLLTGSNRVALNLSRDAHGRLWEALTTNNFSLWRQVREEGHFPTYGCDGDRAGGEPNQPVLLPIRLCCNSRPPIQKRCSLVRDLGSDAVVLTTLGDLLLSWLPEFFTTANRAADTSIRRKEDASVSADPRTVVRPKFSTVSWRVAGLSNLSLEAPLLLLWSHLAHPDQFLYVCVVTVTTNRS